MSSYNNANIDKREIINNYINNNFKNDNYYLNIFLLLKLIYLCKINENNNNKHIYVPKTVIKTFTKNLKDISFLHIMGCSDVNGINGNSIDIFTNQMIIIPEDLIYNYFQRNNTHCNMENIISQKLDLYLSILTYIYHNTYSSILNKDFHNQIISYIRDEINTFNCNDNIINLLYQSEIYNFQELVINIKDFEYKFSKININIFEYFRKYDIDINDISIPNYDNIDINKLNYYEFIVHHLIMIHSFYNKCILFPLIFNTNYKTHPILEKKCKIEK